MTIRQLPFLLLLVLPVAACTWVPLEPEAKQVRVVAAGAPPAGCTKAGEVEVSVQHAVGFYERNALKVRDELETLARNEASTVPANTVQPLDQPYNGSQRFAALDCPRR